MKILLTGASGLLGRAVRDLAGDAHELVLMDVDATVEADGGVRASVTDAAAVMAAAEGCDAIIHTAAMHGGSYGKETNAEFMRVNVLGAEHLFAAALRHGIRRVVMSSTMEILVGRDWSASGQVELDEEMPPRPDWVYPLSKLMCEQMGSFYARQHGLEVISLRYVALTRRPVEEVGFALLSHTITARDAAQANMLAATTPGLRDWVFNIGPDTPLRQCDINKAATDPAGVLEKHWPGCMEVLRGRKLQPQSKQFWPVTRSDRAKAVLGYRPQSRFDNFLRSLGWTPQAGSEPLVSARGEGPDSRLPT